MKRILYFPLLLIITTLISCASSKSTTTVSNGTDLSKYKYIVFGKEDDGDAELADILMMVQNELSGKLTVVSDAKAVQLIAQGESVLSPRINVKSEKWDGGHYQNWSMVLNQLMVNEKFTERINKYLAY